MEVNFNVQGQRRKKLVTLIATYTEQKAEYQYTPSYAYKIGKYKVDQHGTLSSPDDIPDSLLEYLTNLGFTATEVIQLNVSYPRDAFTDQSLENLRHLVWAKGQLIKDAFDIKALHIIVDDQQVSFDWFNKVNPDEAAAYQHLSISWCNMPKITGEYCQNHGRKTMKNMLSVVSCCGLASLAQSLRHNEKCCSAT